VCGDFGRFLLNSCSCHHVYRPTTKVRLDQSHRILRRVYARNIRRVHRAVWGFLRTMQEAILYGVEQQMILGRKPDLARVPPGPELVLSELEAAVIEAQAALVSKRLGRVVQKVNPEIYRLELHLAGWHCLSNVGANQFARQYVRIYAEAADKAFQLARIDTPWDVVNRRAVDWAATQSASRVTQIIDETRRALRGMISRGIEDGLGTAQVGRRLRGLVSRDGTPMLGLNARQGRALDRFRDKLRARYAEMEGGLTSSRRARLERRVLREADRKLRYRADMIARTETAAAMSEGTLGAYAEAEVQRVRFISSADACIVCLGYDGNMYRREEAGGLIPVHPNCRCTWAPVGVGN
jgi:SPP1 gp7 family putative phage head morphogenesis protein